MQMSQSLYVIIDQVDTNIKKLEPKLFLNLQCLGERIKNQNNKYLCSQHDS